MAVTALSAQAQRHGDRDRHRPSPFPNVSQICIYNMEAKWDTRRFYRGEVVDTFTEFGPRACLMAEDACERSRLNRDRSYNFECKQEFRTRPEPSRKCEYRIETRFGFTREIFSAQGPAGCRVAEDSCEQALKVKRARNEVGPFAKCVQTSSSRPDPRPRTYTRSCTAAQFAGRIGRNTGIEFTETATARSEQEARDRACFEAKRVCENNLRGRMYCEIVR